VSGFLRHRVELWSKARQADGGGGGAHLWTSFATVWARVDRLAAVRDFGGDRASHLRRATATIRFRSDVALGQRFRSGGVFYDIVSVEAGDAREKRLVLVGEEARS
jgi:head-tail adaptor